MTDCWLVTIWLAAAALWRLQPAKANLQRSPGPLAGFEGMWRGKKKERRGKKTKGGKGRGGRGKGKGMEEKRDRKWKGKWRERWYPTFWYKVTPMSARDIHKRRIGLAKRNQPALFMMSINRYYVECVLYSVDITAIKVSNLQVCNCKTLKTL